MAEMPRCDALRDRIVRTLRADTLGRAYWMRVDLDGGVRDDAALDQELAAAAAAGLQPPLVQPQQVGVRGAGGPLADFGQARRRSRRTSRPARRTPDENVSVSTRLSAL